MSKRYHCDYCDRSFIDDLDARKKHLQGTLHTRNRKLHYIQFRNLETLLEEELSKTECRRFLQTGHCPFDRNCNFTHYSQAQLQEIKKQVENDRNLKKSRNLPSVESWLEERNKKIHLNEGSSTQLTYPSDLHDVPVSLRPINFYDAVNIDFNEWG